MFSCSAIFIAAKVFSFRPSEIASGSVYLLQRRIIFPAPVGVGALDFAFTVPHLCPSGRRLFSFTCRAPPAINLAKWENRRKLDTLNWHEHTRGVLYGTNLSKEHRLGHARQKLEDACSFLHKISYMCALESFCLKVSSAHIDASVDF